MGSEIVYKRQVVNHALYVGASDVGRGLPVELINQLVPHLAFDAVARDGLAECDTGTLAVTSRERSADPLPYTHLTLPTKRTVWIPASSLPALTQPTANMQS